MWWLGHPGRGCLSLTISLGVSPGFSLSSVEEEGIHRLYVNSVKETGLALKKGKTLPKPSQVSHCDLNTVEASQCPLWLGLLPLVLLPAFAGSRAALGAGASRDNQAASLSQGRAGSGLMQLGPTMPLHFPFTASPAAQKGQSGSWAAETHPHLGLEHGDHEGSEDSHLLITHWCMQSPQKHLQSSLGEGLYGLAELIQQLALAKSCSKSCFPPGCCIPWPGAGSGTLLSQSS